MKYMLNLPKKIYFKTGSASVALRELREVYHFDRALLVTDPGLYCGGIAAPVVDQLRKQDIRVAEFFTIGKRVSFSDLRSALPKLNEFQPDVIVGIGRDNAMSTAKALLALYEDPELDLASASENPGLIHACTKAKLVLIATNFASGSQNSPFAILKDDAGQICTLKSIHLLPEISITDAGFAATLTAEQIHTCALETLSRAVRAYLDPNCCEFTNGMLLESIALVLKHTEAAMRGSPPALEKLLNAAALAGASYGNIADAITPDLSCFPTEKERAIGDNHVRCADLAEQLGFDSCRALFDACEALRLA